MTQRFNIGTKTCFIALFFLINKSIRETYQSEIVLFFRKSKEKTGNREERENLIVLKSNKNTENINNNIKHK